MPTPVNLEGAYHDLSAAVDKIRLEPGQNITGLGQIAKRIDNVLDALSAHVNAERGMPIEGEVTPRVRTLRALQGIVDDEDRVTRDRIDAAALLLEHA